MLKAISSNRNGFSLLELAIALAVIALLTGGVLKGRSLLQSAAVQATAGELTALETALTTFELRYNALPGDFSAAKSAGLGNGGDGNGRIDTLEEAGATFQHLGQAGFIEGSYIASELVAFDQCPDQTCLEMSVGTNLVLSHSNALATQSQNQLTGLFTQTLTIAVLAELDRRLDDGKATTGKLRVTKDDETLCSTEAGDWNEEGGGNCLAGYIIR